MLAILVALMVAMFVVTAIGFLATCCGGPAPAKGSQRSRRCGHCGLLGCPDDYCIQQRAVAARHQLAAIERRQGPTTERSDAADAGLVVIALAAMPLLMCASLVLLVTVAPCALAVGVLARTVWFVQRIARKIAARADAGPPGHSGVAAS